MRKLLITAGFALAWASPGIAHAQIYPSRPITMVVPVPAGGAFDVAARVLAEHMRTSLGRQVIVENVTGAAGSIGTSQVARGAGRLHAEQVKFDRSSTSVLATRYARPP